MKSKKKKEYVSKADLKRYFFFSLFYFGVLILRMAFEFLFNE